MRKLKINSNKLIEILKQRDRVIKDGSPLFDDIARIKEKVLKDNMEAVIESQDVWKVIKPFIDKKEYKKANDDMAEKYKELQKLEYKMQRLKEKTTDIIENEKIQLDEFEEISKVKLEGNEAVCEIVDLVEEYKNNIREKRNDKCNNSK